MYVFLLVFDNKVINIIYKNNKIHEYFVDDLISSRFIIYDIELKIARQQNIFKYLVSNNKQNIKKFKNYIIFTNNKIQVFVRFLKILI